jgi:formyltetrahydrofolate deformylase
MTSPNSTYIIRGSCRDLAGIVSQITTCLFHHGMNIEEAAQFNDKLSGHFFFRIVFSSAAQKIPDTFLDEFSALAKKLDMDWSCRPSDEKIRTLLLVSKSDHCLNDILYRFKNKTLPIDITGVISNHDNNRQQVEDNGLDFHYLPVTEETKLTQEKSIADIFTKTKSELIVLARYMQVLSDKMSQDYMGQIINIHHSFLPGFKGAKPYHQAHARGVKIIGATAHFVTSDLDEGPIIEQDVTRITHAETPEKLQLIGQDIESRVLLSAIQNYAEGRIFLHGNRTIIL